MPINTPTTYCAAGIVGYDYFTGEAGAPFVGNFVCASGRGLLGKYKQAQRTRDANDVGFHFILLLRIFYEYKQKPPTKARGFLFQVLLND